PPPPTEPKRAEPEVRQKPLVRKLTTHDLPLKTCAKQVAPGSARLGSSSATAFACPPDMDNRRCDTCRLETLEGRVMFAVHPSTIPPGVTWVPYAQAVHQDAAAQHFPAATGAGITVAVIDRGIDY